MALFTIALISTWAIFFIVSYAMRDTGGDDSEREYNFNAPTAKEGASVPLIWGRVRVNAPNVVWYKAERDVYYGSDSPIQFWASTLHFVLGLPMVDPDSVYLRRVWIGDDVHFLGEVHEGECVPTTSNYGDGLEQGGGRVNSYRFHPGRWNADVDPILYLNFDDVTLLPAYRGIINIVVAGARFPISGSVPKFAFEVQTTDDPLGFGAVNSLGDANPVEVIYDILTNPWGRLGLPTARVDSASFIAAATVLESEVNGYSRVQYAAVDAQQVIGEILKQIDAVLYEDISDHTVKIKLVRDDYTISDLALYDESNIVKVAEYTTMNWKGTINQVRVDYTNRDSGYVTKSVFAQDMSNIAIQDGQKRTETISHPGVCTIALANKLAARELKALSLPLSRITLVVNRDAISLAPGDVFRFSWDEYDITDMVLRVLSFDLGALDNNQVKLLCVQDRFATSLEVFDTQDPPLEVAPVEPSAVDVEAVMEAPWLIGYFAEQLGVIADQSLPRLLYLAEKPSVYTSTFGGRSTPAGGMLEYIDASGKLFCDTGDVALAYSRITDEFDETTGLRVDNLTSGFVPTSATYDEVRNGANLIYVNGEFMSFMGVTDLGSGVYTLDDVWRGVLDTVPIDHALNEPVFFVPEPEAKLLLGTTVFAGTEDLDTQLITRNYGGSLWQPDAPVIDIQLANRARSPVRPQRFEVTDWLDEDMANVPTNNPLTIISNQTIASWVRRERDLITVARGDQADNEEPGTIYDIDCKLDSESAWTELVADVDDVEVVASFDGMGHGDAEIRIDAKDDDYSSFQQPTIPFELARYRQLLLNPSFSGDDGTGSLDHWTLAVGTPSVSILNPLTASTTSGWNCTDLTAGSWGIYQQVDVAAFNAPGLTARLRFFAGYCKSGNTITVTLSALNSVGGIIASVNTGSLAPSATEWEVFDLSYPALPALTEGLLVTFAMTDAAGVSGGSCLIDHFDLRIGDMSANLCVNPSFTASLTGWSTSGTWGTTTPAFEDNYSAQCTTTGTSYSSLYQSIAVPTGFARGMVRASAWVQCQNADNAGILRIYGYDGAVSQGSGSATIEYRDGTAWYHYEAYYLLQHAGQAEVDSVSVQLLSVSASGNGMLWDTIELEFFRELNPESKNGVFDFSTPLIQTWPTTRIGFDYIGTLALPQPVAIHAFEMEDIDDVSWDESDGVTVSGGSLQKTAGTSWTNAGAKSNRLYSSDCYIECTVTEVNTYRGFGLTTNFESVSPLWHYSDKNFYVYFENEDFTIYEDGGSVATGTHLKSGDVFRIECRDDEITYWRNGKLVHTSVETVVYPLVASAHLYMTIATLTDVKMGSDLEYLDSVNHEGTQKYGMKRIGGTPATLAGFFDGADMVSETGVEVFAGDYAGAQMRSTDICNVDGTTSWSAILTFRAKEAPATYTPLMGSLSGGQGWELGMSTAGGLRFAVTSASGTTSRSVSGNHAGALHYAAVVYNATTARIWIFTSIAAGTAAILPAGDITNLVPMMVGRSPTNTGCDVQLRSLILHDGANAELVTAQRLDAWWVHALDPSDGEYLNAAISYPLSGEIDADTDGVVVGTYSTNQIPIFYNSGLTAKRGVSAHKAQTNLADPDPNSSAWVEEGTPDVVTHYSLDAERFHRSALVDTDNSDAYRPPAITLAAGNVTAVWYAKGDSAHNARLTMWDTGKAVSIVHDYAVTTAWQRFSHTFSWAGATAAFELWFHGSDDATVRQIELSMPLGVFSGSEAPMVICPITSQAVAAIDVNFSIGPASIRDVQEMGEVRVTGIATLAEPGALSIVNIHNGSDNDDRRELLSTGSQGADFDTYDGAGSALTTASTPGSAIDWSAEWELRGRWNWGGLLENRGHFTNLIYNDTAYAGATTTFIINPSYLSTSVLDNIDFGAFGGLISEVRISSRELGR